MSNMTADFPKNGNCVPSFRMFVDVEMLIAEQPSYVNGLRSLIICCSKLIVDFHLDDLDGMKIISTSSG